MHTRQLPKKRKRRRRSGLVPGGGAWTGLARLVHGSSVITLSTALTALTAGVGLTVLWTTIILLMVPKVDVHMFKRSAVVGWDTGGSLSSSKSGGEEQQQQLSSQQARVHLRHTHRALPCFRLTLAGEPAAAAGNTLTLVGTRSLSVEAGATLL